MNWKLGLVCVSLSLCPRFSLCPLPQISCLMVPPPSCPVSHPDSIPFSWLGRGSPVSWSPVPTFVLSPSCPPPSLSSTSGVVTCQCYHCLSLTTCPVFHSPLRPASLLWSLPQTNSVSHPISNCLGSLPIHLLQPFSPGSVFLPH